MADLQIRYLVNSESVIFKIVSSNFAQILNALTRIFKCPKSNKPVRFRAFLFWRNHFLGIDFQCFKIAAQRLVFTKNDPNDAMAFF